MEQFNARDNQPESVKADVEKADEPARTGQETWTRDSEELGIHVITLFKWKEDLAVTGEGSSFKGTRFQQGIVVDIILLFTTVKMHSPVQVSVKMNLA